MKTKLLIMLLSTLLFASCSQKANIQGELLSKSPQKVLLYAFNQGDKSLIAEQETTEDGKFHFEITPNEAGFYLIGDNEKVLYPVYLKGGEDLSVKINRKNLELVKNNDESNNWLYEWENQVVAVREHAYLQAFIPGGSSVAYEPFFEELNLLADAQKAYVEKLKSCSDQKLANSLKLKSEADLNFYALSYLKANGMNIPDSVQLCDYYQQMKPDELFQNVKILSLPYAGQMLDTYVWYKHKDQQLGEGEKYDYTCLKNRDLQQAYLLTAAARFKFHDEYREMMEELKGEVLTPLFEERIGLIEKRLAWSAPGVQAPDFAGYAPDSSTVSLSQFKGKVLVVDVWATWCVPCKRMMPYFVELEKEFEGQEIEFLSVCMGASIESELWLEMLNKQNLPGHHCFIGSWTGDFAKNYKITGVPRYMVFDRQGKIVSVNAPKPNKLGLKEMILKTLNNQ